VRVRVHRGTQEIGGSCVGVEARDGSRIVLDLGRPLDVAWGEQVALPDVAGLRSPDPSLLGVLISHPHADHSGFFAYSLLVEADGRRLFYTGDLRAHGRKAKLFEELVTDPPADIHVLLRGGYLEESSGLRFRDQLSAGGVELVHLQTSGHASVPDLQRLVAALYPDRVVPIHSEAGDRYAELFPRVDRRADGEWWDVGTRELPDAS
jgi:mRNA degradation ribonuclease J1/J2